MEDEEDVDDLTYAYGDESCTYHPISAVHNDDLDNYISSPIYIWSYI